MSAQAAPDAVPTTSERQFATEVLVTWVGMIPSVSDAARGARRHTRQPSMAEVRTEIDLFDSWYRIADVDKDGKVGGNEAVPFLQRSGLSKDALFKVSALAGISCRQYIMWDAHSFCRRHCYGRVSTMIVPVQRCSEMVRVLSIASFTVRASRFRAPCSAECRPVVLSVCTDMVGRRWRVSIPDQAAVLQCHAADFSRSGASSRLIDVDHRALQPSRCLCSGLSRPCVGA